LLKNPFASKKNGSLRQPQNRRQSPAVVATASLPTETGCCLDDDFAVVAHPGGSFTLNTAKCRGLLPVFGRGELHVVGDVGDGIVVRVDFEFVQRSRREGLFRRGPRRVHAHGRMDVQNENRLARVAWLGERIEIRHVESGIPAWKPELGTGGMV